MRVVLMRRKPRPGSNFSVELIVESLIEHLSSRLEVVESVSRFESNGVLPRVYNVIEAALRQGDVNHVTGDVNFLAYLLSKRHTVLTILDCGRLVRGGSSWRMGLIKLLWFDIPVRRCAAITVISNHVKQQLLGYVDIDPDLIHVVYVAVPSFYRRVDKDFDADRPSILQIGSAPNKNRTRLFDALRGIRCRLVLVGALSAEECAQLAQLELEYESHVGISNEQMFELYKRCDVVAFPSTFEGFGMPIVEANLVGRPVVAGNVASMPEVAGDAACMVDPWDVESIRSGVSRVIEDASYREQLVRNGFENARRFDAATIARQYEAIYRTLGRGRAS